MFDQIHGLPVHALVLHVAVVFVPLLALLAIAYAVIPRWRERIGWATGLLAVGAPLSTFVAMQSGKKLYDRLVGHGLKGKGLQLLNEHMSFGTHTFWWSLALGVVALIVVVLTWRGSDRIPKIAQWAAAVVVIALAVTTVYYTYRTGDSGATAVWGQY